MWMVSRAAKGDHQPPRAPPGGPPSGRVLRLRAKKCLSQEELADLADIKETYLTCVERGKRTPAIGVLQHIAEALEGDIEDLVPRRR